jgi:hypothetical protein
MLEQICVQKLEYKAVMFPKIGLVQHPHYIVIVQWVLLHYVFQVLSLFVSKFVVHLCVTSNFHSKYWFGSILVIPALHHLSEGALAQHLHNLVSVCEMVSWLHLVIAFKVVEDGISLKLSISCVIIHLSLLEVESFDSLCVHLFEHFDSFCISRGNISSVVDGGEHGLPLTELGNLFLEHNVAIVSQELFVANTFLNVGI